MRNICVSLLLGLLLVATARAGTPATPQRLVSLTPHITELLFSIGAGPQIIATDEASDWPVAVKQLPHVANYQSINMERLLALRPDLVVMWSGYQRLMVNQIQALGIPVLLIDSQRLQDLPRDIRILGQATGHVATADTLAQQAEQELQRLQQQYQPRKPVRLLYQLWSPPLTTVAHGSWIQDAISLCGGENPFADSPAPYPQISEEAVLVQQPELIITAQDQQSLDRWLRWPQLPAVQHQQLKVSQPDRLQRLTLRTLAGIDELCQLIDQAR
jgi:vitamin B12 transport system substrate-binding protein